MKLDQLADEYRLNLAVPMMADRVREASGKAIDFSRTPGIGVGARTKMARQAMPAHIIQFNPRETAHLSHVLVKECARILRMFEAPPEERCAPVSTPDTLCDARNEIRGESEFLSGDVRAKMLDVWIHGLITQITSQPIDVRIEHWICDNWPSMREDQKRSLRTETHAITASLSPDVRRMTPASVFRRSHALNYAYLTGIADIMERSFVSNFKGNPEVIALGETLSRIFDRSGLSDQELVNRLAEGAQIRHWFSWVSFEDVPRSYYTSRQSGR